MRFYKHSFQKSLTLLDCFPYKARGINKTGHILNKRFKSVGPGKKYLITVKMVSSHMETEERFKRLPPPVKGLCDKYEYSIIQLKNGLTALLISDVENLITLDPTETVEQKVEQPVDQTVDQVESEDESGNESESGSETDEMEVDESIEDGKKKSDEKLAALSLTVGKLCIY